MNIIFQPFVVIAEYIIEFWTWLTTKKQVKEINNSQANAIRANNDLLVQLGIASGYGQSQLAAQQ